MAHRLARVQTRVQTMLRLIGESAGASPAEAAATVVAVPSSSSSAAAALMQLLAQLEARARAVVAVHSTLRGKPNQASGCWGCGLS